MKKMLVIGTVWPEPKSSAAGTRMLQLLQLFLNQKFEVHFACSAEKSEFSYNLSEINVHCHQILLNDSSFDQFVKELNADFVMFDRFMIEEQFAWRIREISPDTLTILDTEDLHFLREARYQALKNNASDISNFLFSDKTKREIASILRCDLSLIISEFEMDLLRDKFKIPTTILAYLPFWVDDIPKLNPTFNERKDFLFIGNFYHEPNIDAVLTLKKEIWPRIRKMDKSLKINIYGAYIPEKILQLNNPQEGFFIRGRADEVSVVMQNARVFLAPLRFGAGQKGKLLEAMIYGLPSITTPVGAEGMFGKFEWNGFVSSNWDIFCENALKLYTSDSAWEKA
ncbi:MAG: glycosyltransferase, partial [Flavobacteriia bacterium]